MVGFRSWLKLMFAAFGGPGLLLAAFADSSFVPLPLVTDLILMEFCSRHPAHMPYYAAMAALGSLGGSIWIYWLARKGGQAYYRRTQGRPPGRIRDFIQHHPWASVFFPAVAPFPVPFKPFVIAQGALQIPFRTFVIGTLGGRGLLFLFEGFLGARYGEAAKELIVSHKLASLTLVLGIVLLFLLTRRLWVVGKAQYSQAD